MHYDEMIEPIFRRFDNYRWKFKHLNEVDQIRASFYWALKDSIEKLYSEIDISREMTDRGGDDYIKHLEEKRGYELGRAINEKPELCNSFTNKEYYGTKIHKEIFIVKLNTQHKETEE